MKKSGEYFECDEGDGVPGVKKSREPSSAFALHVEKEEIEKEEEIDHMKKLVARKSRGGSLPHVGGHVI
jgi:hypothetical protein